MASTGAAAHLESLPVLLKRICAAKNSSLDILSIIYQIYSNSHFYLAQWKALNTDIATLEEIASLVRRYEGSFQLKGFGVWLIDMFQTHLTDLDCLAVVINAAIVEDLLRISVEHNTNGKCVRIFTRLVHIKAILFLNIYNTGEHRRCPV